LFTFFIFHITEAKDEYITRYLEGSIGRATWGNVESTSRPSLHCADKDDGPLGPNAVSRLPHLAVSSDEAAQLGYMPNRDDFERVILTFFASIHTYHSHLIPEGVAEASQIFLRGTHVLPK
jgi:hypothetical protein